MLNTLQTESFIEENLEISLRYINPDERRLIFENNTGIYKYLHPDLVSYILEDPFCSRLDEQGNIYPVSPEALGGDPYFITDTLIIATSDTGPRPDGKEFFLIEYINGLGWITHEFGALYPFTNEKGKDLTEYWAPEIVYDDNLGEWIMYFTAGINGNHSIYWAKSPSPKGPFITQGMLLNEGTDVHVPRNFDNTPLKDMNGMVPFYYCKALSDGYPGAKIVGRLLDPDNMRLMGEEVATLNPTASWHKTGAYRIVEGGNLLKLNNSALRFYHSGGSWNGGDYGVGEAIHLGGESILGPYRCIESSPSLLYHVENILNAPGHFSFKRKGIIYIAFGAKESLDSNNPVRHIYILPVGTYPDGKLGLFLSKM
jgi:hypothetical protein